MQVGRREEGEGGGEQLVKASPRWKRDNCQPQEQSRLEHRGFHTLVILSFSPQRRLSQRQLKDNPSKEFKCSAGISL